MAVAFRSASIGTNLSTSLPSGHAAGDVLLALVSTETNGTTPTAATGWTLVLGDTSLITGGRPLSAHVYWIARGGSAPATNWATGGADTSQVGYLCYTGVDNTSPIDASVHNEDGAGGSSTVVWSAITVATDQSMMVGLAAINQWQSCTPAQWTNERADGGATIAAHLFDDGLKGTGSTGTKTETIGAGWHTFTIALKPAGGGSDASATPSVVTASGSVPAPTVAVGSTAAAAAVTASGSVPAPTAAAGSTATATVVTGTGSVPSPTAAVGSTITATVVTAAASVPAPTASASSTATADVVTASGSVPAPTVATGIGATPAVVTATASIPAPTPTTGSTATPTVVTATGDVPAPQITAGGTASATPTVVTATGDVPAPTVAVGVTVTATVVTAVGDVLAPTATASSTATPAVVTGTGSVPAPTPAAGGSATATPDVVTATGSVPAPAAITTGAGAAANVVTAIAAVLGVTVIVGQVAGDRWFAPVYRRKLWAPTFHLLGTIGTRPLWLDPSVGTVTTPDPGPLQTEVCFVARVHVAGNSTAVAEAILSQGTSLSYRLAFFSASLFIQTSSTAGTLRPGSAAASTAQLTASGITAGADAYIAGAVDHDNGSSAISVRGYASTDGATYSPIASAVTSSPAITTPSDGSGVLRIGNVPAVSPPFIDRIYSVELRTGLDPTAGTVLWRFDAAEAGTGTSWTDPRGRAWTITDPAALTYGNADRHKAPTHREPVYAPTYQGTR